MAIKAKQSSSLGKGGVIAIVVSVAVVIVLLVVIVVLLSKRKEPEEEVAVRRNVMVTQGNVDDVVGEMLSQEYVAPGYYSTSMSTTWHFATGEAVSEDAYVENKAKNTNDVYFDVFLADDEENPILQSPVIPRGARLDDIALDTPLDAGTHDCVVVYHLVDDEQNTISTLRIALTIIVEQ